ncbi:MAG: hypothetical protein OXR67_11010 [Chloroflexota bacterium]|nr:hypothetical protein [Chloroflexota bacterium]
MADYTAYSFKARRQVPVNDVKLVRYKNGRYGIQGQAAEGPECVVSKMISTAQAQEMQAAGYTVNDMSGQD